MSAGATLFRIAGVLIASVWLIGSPMRRQAAALSCGDTITSTVVMTADLDCSAYNGTGLTIDSGGRLDMNGHQVKGKSNQVVIHMIGGGGRAENGVVYNGLVGFVLLGTGGHKITKVSSKFNLYHGFYVTSGCNGNKFDRTSAHGSNFKGYLIESDSNRLFDAVAAANQGGGFDIRGDSNKLTRCTAAGNYDYGFNIEGTGHRLTNSAAISNSADGIVLLTGDHHQLKDVRSSKNGGMGIRIVSNDTRLTRGKVIANVGTGLQLAGNNITVKKLHVDYNGIGIESLSGAGNKIQHCRVYNTAGIGLWNKTGTSLRADHNVVIASSGFVDIEDDIVSCASNDWSNNVFGTKNVSCID